MTIQTIIDSILQTVPEAPLEGSVDTFKSGDPSAEVTGIVTTFMATMEVIEKAIKLKANLIITHEPTYYNGQDEIEWLQNDPVYKTKRLLLEENHITVWRFHDYWHMHEPDGIVTGVIKELGWECYQDEKCPVIFHLPSTTIFQLSSILKEKLGITCVRIVGNPNMSCSHIGLLVGSVGGKNQIKFLQENEIDVLLCGESTEWETVEYIRDASISGRNKALMLLGHANSEEAGMKYLVDWLKPKFPGLPITFVPAGDPMNFI